MFAQTQKVVVSFMTGANVLMKMGTHTAVIHLSEMTGKSKRLNLLGNNGGFMGIRTLGIQVNTIHVPGILKSSAGTGGHNIVICAMLLSIQVMVMLLHPRVLVSGW
jgi:hypothetical protein